jgi:hypothetical protein
MADFSKQWCEINDPQLPHDFDIYDEFNKLNKGTYVTMICEGFGFLAIARDQKDVLLLAMPVNDGLVEWVTLDKLLDIGE